MTGGATDTNAESDEREDDGNAGSKSKRIALLVWFFLCFGCIGYDCWVSQF